MLATLMGFEKYLAPTLIRIVYWVGIVLIVLSTLVAVVGGGGMFGQMMGNYGGGFSLGGAIAALIGGAVGLVLWRVLCEVWMVIFSINDRLGQLVERGKV